MQLSITLQNKTELLKTFQKAPGIAMEEYRNSLDRIASMVQSKAMHYAPVGKYKGGGNLRQSIIKKPYGTTGFMVYVGVKYGVFVDQGTKPHLILPRRKPFLAWQNAEGKWIYAKKVNHPGTKGTFFFTNAVKETESYANTEMSNAMGRVLSRIAEN